jgi:UDP-N-acetylmuramyl pentapeptide phosphotransferase/UDP-N-acetylglucosamine-1-phosphate transferase
VIAILTFFASAVVCGLLMWPTRVLLLRAGIVDHPNARSSHAIPTVRGSGIAIALVALGGLLIVGRTIPSLVICVAAPVLAIAAISFTDDLIAVRVQARLAVQASASLLALAWLLFLTSPGFTSVDFRSILEFGFGAIWVVGYTNVFNFMDGINGLAGFQAVVSGLGMVTVGSLAGLPLTHPALVETTIVAGASAGFLPFNFPRARVFMGDVGSASVGFILAILTFWIAHDAGWWLLMPLACLHANFILDAGFTMARRFARGEVLYHAHREHFYQRLVRAGHSHGFVTSAEILIQFIVVLVVALGVNAGPAERFAVAAIVIAIWCVFFAFAEFEFRRYQRIRVVP